MRQFITALHETIVIVGTSPGIILNQAAKKFFYDMRRIPVYEVCYLRLIQPAGYVTHAPVKDLGDAFTTTVGPLIVNSTLCALLTLPMMFDMLVAGDAKNMSPLLIIAGAVGVAIGMNAFPSNEDIEALIQEKKKARKTTLYYLTKPFTLLMRLERNFKAVAFDIFYAFAAGTILATILVNI